jgi:putative phosphoesterase
MKIVVISDTHGDLSALRRVALIEYDADLYLHAGDVEASSGDIAPFAAVKGNCDGAFPDFPFRYETMTPFGKLHMEHYPIYSSAMIAALKQDGVRILIHGHTHEKEEELLDGVLVFCPGSLTFPHDSDSGTYLVLDVNEKEVKSTFKTIVA